MQSLWIKWWNAMQMMKRVCEMSVWPLEMAAAAGAASVMQALHPWEVETADQKIGAVCLEEAGTMQEFRWVQPVG
jgi:hypothetical protein